MASDAGLQVFTGKRDYDAVKKEIAAAGYKGEKVVILAPTDFPILKAEADVCADQFKKMGFNVDYQAMDWGTVVQRRAKEDPPDKGGWRHVQHLLGRAWISPIRSATPSCAATARRASWAGLPAPKIEALRTEWIEAPEGGGAEEDRRGNPAPGAAGRALYSARPYSTYVTSYQKDISGVLDGFVIFWKRPNAPDPHDAMKCRPFLTAASASLAAV